ncbi:flagella basal body P-ring formation protein FlgA [Candidatus Omnitrophota bacterium]
MKKFGELAIGFAQIIITIIVLFAAFLYPSKCAEAFEVVIKDHAVVSNDKVYFKDIASINGLNYDDALFEELNNTYICKAPRAGYKREINKAYLIMKLKQKRFLVSEMMFTGAMYTHITAEEYVVSVEQQKSAFKSWLAETLDLSQEEFKVVYRKEPRDILVANPAIEISFKGDEKTFMMKNVGVYMELYADNKLLKRSVLNFSIHTLKDVVMPKQLIGKDAEIMRDDIELRKQFVATHSNDYISDVESVIGSVANYNLSSDSYIKNKDIRLKNIIERGEVVDCVLRF